MYRNSYVAAVMADGRVLDEDSSSRVMLPFGMEYKVRLINKNYDRCAADLIINGEKIARFILDAGQTSDIERYVDNNMHSGSKFKFTNLNDGQVKDRNSFENGLVEVLFYREIKKPDPIVIREDHHHWHDYHKPYQPPSYPWPVVYGNGGVAFGNAQLKGMCSSSESYSMACNAINTDAGMEGATVRGSSSDQKFKEVSGYEFDSTATIIKLKIVNGELQSSMRYCSSCGRKRQGTDKFCPNCGNKF